MTDNKGLKACPFCGTADHAAVFTASQIADCDHDNEHCDGCAANPAHDEGHTVVCDALDGGCGAMCGYKASRKLAIAAWNAQPAPDASKWGPFRHNNGVICCGTLRIARADFDTNPSPEVQKEILDALCSGKPAPVAAQGGECGGVPQDLRADDDAAWGWINARARQTYRHHLTQCRGQQITRADNETSHWVWAAIEWDRQNRAAPPPQSLDAGDEARLEAILALLANRAAMGTSMDYKEAEQELRSFFKHVRAAKGGEGMVSVLRNDLRVLLGNSANTDRNLDAYNEAKRRLISALATTEKGCEK